MNLSDPVENIKGVGPKTTEILAKIGIKTIRDLFYYLPRTYENYQENVKIKDIRPGKVVLKGKISGLETKRARRRNFTITEGVIRDETDAISVVWFNQPYRAKQFEEGKEYYFTGTFEFSHGKYQLLSPKTYLAKDIDDKTQSGFRPVYRASGRFKSENFVQLFSKLRSDFAFIPDLLPEDCVPDFLQKTGRNEALFKAHYAENDKDVEKSREYLAYEELFELILAANLNKNEISKLKAKKIPFNKEKIAEFVKKLSFNLTNAQRRATWEILQDLEKPIPMNRLLQGDVGSGKTIVAAISAYQAALSGEQVAILAPTAVLAKQHAESLSELLEPFGVRVALLTGATKNKPLLKKKIKEGEVDVLIGTHAIITDDTEFKSLSLCIIDEQHRFGVNQRQKLLMKTEKTSFAPHLLSMSATPIPRSLQLAIFGDMDVSILDEMPKGRKPIKTEIISELDFTDILYKRVRETLEKKQQIYWICKTIDKTSEEKSISVKKMAERLEKTFPDAKISYLHGRMKNDEKDKIMEDFSGGKIDILVSTTVVEVGVNVPNANLMVIMDAESYGLAQIHQLRGRVGRGKEASECYLVIENEKQPSRRLRELEKSTDGFYLAEVDLKLRGPGEIYGSLQHGALDLNIATLADTKLISIASKYAKKFAKNPENVVKYPELNTYIKKYQQLTTLN